MTQPEPRHEITDDQVKSLLDELQNGIPSPRQPDGYGRYQGIAEHLRRKEFTTGYYETEKESAAAFDRAVPFELFRVEKEVLGAFINPRPAQVNEKSTLILKIDRVLVPTSQLLRLGWRFGIIGCEVKNSGVKIGPAIAQAMDYTHTVWKLEPSKFRVWLDYVFIWPMAKQGCAIASICTQNQIGSAYGDDRVVQFGLRSGETEILTVGQDGSVRLGNVLTGARVGSR